jgi:CheY-like chemotaxis protein
VTAKNGLEGLMKLKEMCDDLDLCIMDLQMPVMDGIESTEKYRSWERERALECPLIRNRLPIIFSSANCSAIAEKRALAAGVDSFLPKPFSMAALASAIEQARSLSHSPKSSFSHSSGRTSLETSPIHSMKFDGIRTPIQIENML